MNEIVGGVGGAIEGALLGGAVEPGHGARVPDAARKSGEPETADDTHACLNCGAYAPGAYCPNCGQKTHLHRTLSAIGHDLIHGVLHLDGKLWRTLPMLAFWPGRLTRRYIEGKRADFVSPMAMFLFSVFSMFAVFQMVGLSVPTDLVESDLGSTFDTARTEMTASRARIVEEIATLEGATGTGAERREELQSELAAIDTILGTAGLSANEEGIEVASDEKWTVNLTGVDGLDQGIVKKWRENPGLMLYKLQANGYKFSWLLIPLSIPFVWLMFAWRRRFKAYDHAIFITYSLAFMSLLFIVTSIVAVSPLGAGWASTIFSIVAPLHLYKHLRHAYELSRFSAIWRFMALLVFIGVVIVLFLQALLVLGAF